MMLTNIVNRLGIVYVPEIKDNKDFDETILAIIEYVKWHHLENIVSVNELTRMLHNKKGL